MTRAKIVIASFVALLFGVGVPAVAATVSATVSEQFDRNAAKSSGHELLGLVLGPLTGAADPSAIQVPLAPAAPSAARCIDAGTIEGSYSGSATFTISTTGSGYGTLDPRPKWKYIKELSAMDRRNFAVVGIANAACENADDSTFFPISYAGDQRTLTADLNLPGILVVPSARLQLADKHVAGGSCVRVTRIRTVHYNVQCTFGLPESGTSGLAKLVVHVIDSGSEHDDPFLISMP
jgi:hypothetical protein